MWIVDLPWAFYRTAHLRFRDLSPEARHEAGRPLALAGCRSPNYNIAVARARLAKTS
jgi:hypothetical protein